jgi:TonB family protein
MLRIRFYLTRLQLNLGVRWISATDPMQSLRSYRSDAVLALLSVVTIACRTAFLPTAMLAHLAPACGAAPIEPRQGDATPTYFRCQVDRAAVPSSALVFRYPSPLASANVEGTVALQFVVDQRGVVDPTTIVVLQSTHDLFTAAARESLRDWRAEPAQRHGAAVRQLTTQGFCFLLVAPASTATPSCQLDRRYPGISIARSCENAPTNSRTCTDGCSPEPPPRPRFMNQCP